MYIIYRQKVRESATREFLTKDKTWKDATYVVFNSVLCAFNDDFEEYTSQKQLHSSDWELGFIKLN